MREEARHHDAGAELAEAGLGPLALRELERELGIAAARRERQRKAAAEAGLTSVTGSEPSGSRKHWTLAGPTIPAVSATRAACAISSSSWIVAPLIDSPPFDWIIVRGIAFRQRLSRSQKRSTENSSPRQHSCTNEATVV